MVVHAGALWAALHRQGARATPCQGSLALLRWLGDVSVSCKEHKEMLPLERIGILLHKHMGVLLQVLCAGSALADHGVGSRVSDIPSECHTSQGMVHPWDGDIPSECHM